MSTDSTKPLLQTVNLSRAAVLAWYDAQGRELPWRVRPDARARGMQPDPYRVWLSEIMLQQTVVASVRGYYAAFLTRWPKVEHLAAAPLSDVLSAWAGLGYYARARNLHACAQMVMDHHDGIFPQTEAGLRALPGIGDYTAAAMMAIIHCAPTNVIDGNIERVMARLHRHNTPLPRAKAQLKAIAAHYVTPIRAEDWPQALMDLGAIVCRPKNPDCNACPLNQFCAAAKAGDATSYPRRAPKKVKQVRFGAAFVLRRHDSVLLRRRPAKGLLGAMSEVPGTVWGVEKGTSKLWLEEAPVTAKWCACGTVRHVFTHFILMLDVYEAEAPESYQINEGWWAALNALDDEALPSLMRKVLAQADMPPK